MPAASLRDALERTSMQTPPHASHSARRHAPTVCIAPVAATCAAQVSRLSSELGEYKAESRAIKNQDLTLRRQEETIRELNAALAAKAAEAEAAQQQAAAEADAAGLERMQVRGAGRSRCLGAPTAAAAAAPDCSCRSPLHPSLLALLLLPSLLLPRSALARRVRRSCRRCWRRRRPAWRRCSGCTARRRTSCLKCRQTERRRRLASRCARVHGAVRAAWQRDAALAAAACSSMQLLLHSCLVAGTSAGC